MNSAERDREIARQITRRRPDPAAQTVASLLRLVRRCRGLTRVTMAQRLDLRPLDVLLLEHGLLDVRRLPAAFWTHLERALQSDFLTNPEINVRNRPDSR